MRVRTPYPPRTIPLGPDFPDNTARHRALRSKRQLAQRRLECYVRLAERACTTPPIDAAKCGVIWHELNELQTSVDELDRSLAEYWECWSADECKVYDV